MLEQKKKTYNETKVVTVIGRARPSRDIKSKGTIRIEGVVQGRVFSEDTIVIHERPGQS